MRTKYLSIFLVFIIFSISMMNLLHVEALSNNLSINLNNYQIGMFYNPASSQNITSDLIKMKNNGISWIRFNFAWNIIEPSPGNFNFSLYDNFVNVALSMGFKLIGILGTGATNLMPLWLQNTGGVNNSNYLSYLNQYAKLTVQRYGNKVNIWQIENELNDISFYLLVGFRQGNWNFQIAKSILQTLSSDIRNYSSSPIMINVLVDNLNWKTFLQNLTIWNISYDVIGIDYYPTYLDDYSSNPGSPNKGLLIYNYITQAESFNKSVIVAETGYSTYNNLHTYSEQAEYVKRIVEGSALAGVKLIAFYQYSDPNVCISGSNTVSSVEANFGFIDCKGNYKPSWYELKNLASMQFNLKINTLDALGNFNSTVKIDNITVQTPLNSIVPSINITLHFANKIQLMESFLKYQYSLFNNENLTSNTYSISISQNTTINAYYSVYYLLKVLINVPKIGYLNASVQILANNTAYNLTNGELYLKQGNYKIILPSNITLYGLNLISVNNTLFVTLNSPMQLDATYIPLYNLTVITFDWLGNLAQSNIVINGKSYYSSLITVQLPAGNYSLTVSSMITKQSSIINLNGNTYYIAYVPNFILFALLIIIFALIILLPLGYALVKKKLPKEETKIYKAIISGIGYIITLIIIPYVIPNYISELLTHNTFYLWNLTELIIFGLPVAILSFLSLIKKPNIPWSLLTTFSLLVYIYFIVGRAYNGMFGIYSLTFMNISFTVNIAIYVIIIMVLTAIRGIASFFISYIMQ